MIFKYIRNVFNSGSKKKKIFYEQYILPIQSTVDECHKEHSLINQKIDLLTQSLTVLDQSLKLLERSLTLLDQKQNSIQDKFDELMRFQNYFKYKNIFQQRFNINIPADACGYFNKYELVKIKLKDINRGWFDGKIYSLKECSPYRFLQTKDESIYQDYIKKHVDVGYITDSNAMTYSIERFLNLAKEIENSGYDPHKSVVVIDENNVIVDGLHRCSILLYKNGEEYEIVAVKAFR